MANGFSNKARNVVHLLPIGERIDCPDHGQFVGLPSL
jgi:hypothetical protein